MHWVWVRLIFVLLIPHRIISCIPVRNIFKVNWSVKHKRIFSDTISLFCKVHPHGVCCIDGWRSCLSECKPSLHKEGGGGEPDEGTELSLLPLQLECIDPSSLSSFLHSFLYSFPPFFSVFLFMTGLFGRLVELTFALVKPKKS